MKHPLTNLCNHHDVVLKPDGRQTSCRSPAVRGNRPAEMHGVAHQRAIKMQQSMDLLLVKLLVDAAKLKHCLTTAMNLLSLLPRLLKLPESI